MNLELLTKQVANLCRAVGKYIKSEQKNLASPDVDHKGFNDFVTYVDKNSEERLVSELAKILPQAGFIAEENSDLKKAKHFNWIIDPLDGTTNFIHGVPLYAISIALENDGEIVSGVVYEVNLNECFYAWEKGGAHLNGFPISTSSKPTLADSLMATGFPYSDFSRIESYLDVFLNLMKTTHGVRRLGSAATDLAYVACGRSDGFYEYGLHAWGVAAGVILVKEAGGKVSDFKGGSDFIHGKEIVAANSHIFKEFLGLIEAKFD